MQYKYYPLYLLMARRAHSELGMAIPNFFSAIAKTILLENKLRKFSETP